MNEFSSSASVDADHACLAGHFPGNPIVPGVVILELVAAALREWRGAPVWIRKFGNVKFIGVLRPGERMDIRLQQDAAQVRFRCSSGERLLSQGSFEFDS